MLIKIPPTACPFLAISMKGVAEKGSIDVDTNYSRSPYFVACGKQHNKTGAVIRFTRDTSYHTSGWWKNPDYERCYHLSLSFFDPHSFERIGKQQKLSELWVKEFFGNNRKLLWCEPPFSPIGKTLDVWHYRLFCDESWNPIKPRGEVYTREFTEAGWLSWSDVEHRKSLQEGCDQ
jgi:hypothetical protein